MNEDCIKQFSFPSVSSVPSLRPLCLAFCLFPTSGIVVYCCLRNRFATSTIRNTWMSAQNYLDIDLQIDEMGDGTFRARVLDSPVGQAEATFDFPFSDLELENFFLRIGRPRRGVRQIDSPEKYYWSRAEFYAQLNQIEKAVADCQSFLRWHKPDENQGTLDQAESYIRLHSATSTPTP